jgi:uncharacterized BrkB/YihY/UPF0761 family membrane protein
MNLQRFGAIIVMMGLLLAFLLMMPIILTATTTASANATAVGDSGASAILNIMPLITSVAGIGIALFFMVKVHRG